MKNGAIKKVHPFFSARTGQYCALNLQRSRIYKMNYKQLENSSESRKNKANFVKLTFSDNSYVY